jgi:alpha-ribazole phosphatase
MSASTWVYLLRHGEVEGAADGRFFGHTDVALSAVGVRQVEGLARALEAEPIEAVYASDLCRARQSAEPLARARGVPLAVLPALREVAMGRWEGLTFRQIRDRDPETLGAWLGDPTAIRFPGGESFADLRARILPTVEEVLARHGGRRVAIVAHGGSNRIILAEALGLPLANAFRLAQDYACLNLVEYGSGGPILHGVNQRLTGIAAAPPVETTAALER